MLRGSSRIVTVTGAAGGIGVALCRRFAAEGAEAIVAVDLDSDRLADLAAEIGVIPMAADVRDPDAIVAVIRQAEDRFGRIDVLVQNAGHFAFGGPEAPDEVWQRCLDVNLLAHVRGARAVLPGMLARGDGHVVNMCSAAGILTDPAAAPYAVSKRAAVAFAEWLAVACRDTGVRISAVCPQSVDTSMLDAFLAGVGPGAEAFVGEVLSAEVIADRILAGMAEGRFLIYTHDTTAEAELAHVRDREAWIRAQPRLYTFPRPTGGGAE
jgi:NAD(P)-dependent dehydrogenase (short-subunit alcohol dehydrogenase family)